MKKVNVVMTMIVLLVMASCGSSPEEAAKVDGKWLLTDVKITEADGSEFTGNQQKADEIIQSFLDEKKSYEFLEDEKLIITKNGQKEEGKYVVVDIDGKISHIALFTDKVPTGTKIEMDKFTEKEFITHIIESDVKFTFTFTKQ